MLLHPISHRSHSPVSGTPRRGRLAIIVAPVANAGLDTPRSSMCGRCKVDRRLNDCPGPSRCQHSEMRFRPYLLQDTVPFFRFPFQLVLRHILGSGAEQNLSRSKIILLVNSCLTRGSATALLLASPGSPCPTYRQHDYYGKPEARPGEAIDG